MHYSSTVDHPLLSLSLRERARSPTSEHLAPARIANSNPLAVSPHPTPAATRAKTCRSIGFASLSSLHVNSTQAVHDS